MSTQPEALRLADALDYGVNDAQMARVMDKAASQLRRLHAEVERLSWDSIHTCHSECQRPLCKLTRERDALLSALKGMLLHMGMDEDEWNKPTFDHARAAIKAVEEGK